MNLYDHRFATYEGATGMSLPAVTDAQHDEPGYEPLPRYWVAEDEVTKALGDTWTSSYLFGWRWITAATNERTFVSGNFPLAGAGGRTPFLGPGYLRVLNCECTCIWQHTRWA